MNSWIRSFRLRLPSSSNSRADFCPGGFVFGHDSFAVWGHYFRITFNASRYKYVINNEIIKGEEVK